MCLLLLSILLSACNKSPIERAQDASHAGALGSFGSGQAFVVFRDELQSGGGAFLFPHDEGQTLDFRDASNALSQRSIRYTWNGQDVASSFGPEHTFAGFDLMHTPTLADYASTPGRDLRAAGYTKVTFFSRGSLSSNTLVKVQAADDGDPNTPSPCLSLSANGTDDDINNPCGRTAALGAGWQPYSIPVTGAALASVKDHFKATFIFNPPFVGSTAPGQGGTVYFDLIQYEP